MAKRKFKTEFERELRAWQKSKGFLAKEAATFIGVGLSTYRHWLYDGAVPDGRKCRECIEKKMAE